MSLVDEIQAIKNSGMTEEEKKKAIRKLRRKARVPKAHEDEESTSSKNLVDSILQEASALPLYDPEEQGGYAFSLRAAIRTPGTTLDTLKGVFTKRLGYEPQVHAVVTLPWDTLLLLGPVK